MKLPQLSLRDLFWLVLVAAMGCAWWMEWRERSRIANYLKEAHERNEELAKDNMSLVFTMQELYQNPRSPLREQVGSIIEDASN